MIGDESDIDIDQITQAMRADEQQLEQPDPPRPRSWVARKFQQLRVVVSENYFDYTARQRHRIEEDARRFGGEVTWKH